jgi:2-polyprenyl-3-methyl-5-hydroxy-6-metoxy-1,4-benzoquinol methylase
LTRFAATTSYPTDGGKILDVGCGDGLFFERLSQFGDVEGIEPVSELVNTTGVCEKRTYIAPLDEDFRSSDRYSLILMLDVLEHFLDPTGALRQALTLLTPGGTVLVTVPAFKLLRTNHDVIT